LVVVIATEVLETTFAVATIYVGGNHHGDNNRYFCANDDL
jgi:hypothetical protein